VESYQVSTTNHVARPILSENGLTSVLLCFSRRIDQQRGDHQGIRVPNYCYLMKILAATMKLLLALVIALVSPGACGRPSSPAGLLVNGMSNPLAIDQSATRFTWRLTDKTRGEAQRAYQILVSSSPAGTGDGWDSGKVVSNQSASVEYSGKLLPPTTCFWRGSLPLSCSVVIFRVQHLDMMSRWSRPDQPN